VTEYHAFEVVIKVQLLSKYELERTGQVYDVFLHNKDEVLLYKNIKPSRLSTLLEVVVFNPAERVKFVPE